MMPAGQGHRGKERPVNGEVRVVDDVPTAFAALFEERAPQSIALSGGSTAEQCYEQLRVTTGNGGIDWAGVDVYLGDERYLPVTDPESNEGMARRVLLDAVAPRAIHSMAGAGATAEAAATSYDALVRAAAPIGLVHLGLGPDGHTASLFPRTPALDERDRWVVTNEDALHPHPRLTFTFPAIAASRLVVFTVAGENKRAAFTRIRGGEALPGGRVDAQELIWLVDPAAAGD
jgi:6-phosphogluconolactonase